LSWHVVYNNNSKDTKLFSLSKLGRLDIEPNMIQKEKKDESIKIE
jgi:hypothetical protein